MIFWGGSFIVVSCVVRVWCGVRVGLVGWLVFFVGCFFFVVVSVVGVGVGVGEWFG